MGYISIDKTIFSAAALAAVLALQAAPAAAVDVGTWSVANDVKGEVTVAPADYCNIKIPAPNNDQPSGNDEPQMTPQWDDWIDYSGPCDQADIEDALKDMSRPTSADD